jgi:hypothetical protein
VLDFRRTNQGRNSPRPQSQKWLLRAALLLGVVLILAGWAQRPGLWKWIDGLVAPDKVGDAGDIDNRLEAVQPPELADGFSIPQDKPAEKSGDAAHFYPGVKPEWFEPIRDNKPSSREEQPCTMALLNILQKTEIEKLRKASVGPTSYAQLFRQPKQYRGRLVTVSGLVRAAHRFELPKNEYGLKEYYQIWLYPFDSRATPIVVYCLELPKGFPRGKDFAEEAEITGFFFKRWAYFAGDVIRVAPTLLAKTLEWRQRPAMLPKSPDGAWATLTVVAAMLAAMLTAWFIYLRTKPPRPALPKGLPDLDKLRRMDESAEPPANADQENSE